MTTQEALKELEQRGIRLTYWKLRGLIVRGSVPRPRLNSALTYDWTERDVRNVEVALAALGETGAST
jgi:hypothetical protein